MNIEIYNIRPDIPNHRIRAAIARVLHSGEQTKTVVKFHLHVFQGPSTQNLYGLLTLPYAGIGRRLLKAYGGERPRLYVTIGQSYLLFRKSQVNICWSLINLLRDATYVATAESKGKFKPRKVTHTGAIAVAGIQFGWETRDGCYSVEYEHSSEESSIWYDASQRRFVVGTTHDDKAVLIVIRAPHVSWAAYGTDDTPSTIFFLSLQYPPSYESATSSQVTARARHSSLNNELTIVQHAL